MTRGKKIFEIFIKKLLTLPPTFVIIIKQLRQRTGNSNEVT